MALLHRRFPARHDRRRRFDLHRCAGERLVGEMPPLASLNHKPVIAVLAATADQMVSGDKHLRRVAADFEYVILVRRRRTGFVIFQWRNQLALAASRDSDAAATCGSFSSRSSSTSWSAR